MNTINSFRQTLATEGQHYNTAASQNKAAAAALDRDALSSTVITPNGAEVAQNIVRSIDAVKADVQQLQKMSDMVMGRKLQFNVNDELGSIVVKVVDPNTDQVIKEIPSEDIQKLKIRLRKAIGLLFDEMV